MLSFGNQRFSNSSIKIIAGNVAESCGVDDHGSDDEKEIVMDDDDEESTAGMMRRIGSELLYY